MSADEEQPVRRRRVRPFIVELTTRDGPISERFATYEQARQRVEDVPPESLLGLPLIFQELPDGSYRAVREDGKPLQWHRIMDETVAPEALPLSDEEPSGKPIIARGERGPEA